MTDPDKLESVDYKPPDYLPRPETPTPSFPVLAILVGIAVSVPLGIALFLVGSLLFYIYILYNALIGAAIGRVGALRLNQVK